MQGSHGKLGLPVLYAANAKCCTFKLRRAKLFKEKENHTACLISDIESIHLRITKIK